MTTAAPPTRLGIFILLRRLRMPMLVLIGVYAVTVLGFTLIPGVDGQGQPWRMGFLHAFYFVSFLGTTIGLGEIPHAFTDVQRLWATASIYATVLAWLYAIGALFAVLQAPLFRRIVHENAVERQVRRISEPFYLVCGYDDAGHLVTRELAEEGARLVVIDIESERVEAIDVEDLPANVPALCADASHPRSLVQAGLTSGHCAGVIALTGVDQINTKIALTARLLNPSVPVVCAVREHRWVARMAAAGADPIINPYDTFAERVAMSLRAPSLHVIYEALTTQSGTAMGEAPRLPRGRWLLCGSDLFTHTLRRQLAAFDIDAVVVDTDPADGLEPGAQVLGDPTDPAVLERAGIGEATALVAGTSVDIDNLTITLAAREANKDLFIIARQTQRRNGPVFRAAPADLVVLSGYVIAAEVLRVIRAPQLANFLRRAIEADESWAAALLERMREVIGNEVVESWSVEIAPRMAPGACAALQRAEDVTLQRLMTDGDRGAPVHALPLLLQRGSRRELQPAPDITLREGDRVLFCGRARARAAMRSALLSDRLPQLDATAADALPAERAA